MYIVFLHYIHYRYVQCIYYSLLVSILLRILSDFLFTYLGFIHIYVNLNDRNQLIGVKRTEDELYISFHRDSRWNETEQFSIFVHFLPDLSQIRLKLNAVVNWDTKRMYVYHVHMYVCIHNTYIYNLQNYIRILCTWKILYMSTYLYTLSFSFWLINHNQWRKNRW